MRNVHLWLDVDGFWQLCDSPVGWVERSETHQLQFIDGDGFREGLNPSYEFFLATPRKA